MIVASPTSVRPCASRVTKVRPSSIRVARSRVSVVVRAQQFDNPVRSAIAGVVSGIYKATAAAQVPDPSASPLWNSLKRLDLAGVRSAISHAADLNERNANGDTPLLFIAREGHYKYPPNEVPQALVSGGADLEAIDKNGLTALQVSLLAGWQNIAELLIKSGANTKNVPEIKAKITCPDCKRLVAQYNL